MAKLKSDGATVVLIAHRPSMVSQVDKILYLRDGLVEMFGPREEVLPQVTRPVSVRQAKTGS
jgi:ABC-type protease/lipase transport system fused ATPase/permease subunit